MQSKLKSLVLLGTRAAKAYRLDVKKEGAKAPSNRSLRTEASNQLSHKVH
jgi:hypothetical protein